MKKIAPILIIFLMLSGCNSNQARPKVESVPPSNIHFLQVDSSQVQGNELLITAHSVSEAEANRTNQENILDIDNVDGIINYATATAGDQNIQRVRVLQNNQELSNITIRPEYDTDAVPENLTNPSTDNLNGNAMAESQALNQTAIKIPPPGVKLDPNIRPLASTTATRSKKVEALRKVGESKLGVKYAWGHNEDRGQVGFDCSNYAAYVFHHALGYSFSTASRNQYRYVGVKVPVSNMQPGDLIAFNSGRHIGIFMGNGRMIQMGGGTGKCTYLPLKPGSYWYKRISAVKRMF